MPIRRVIGKKPLAFILGMIIQMTAQAGVNKARTTFFDFESCSKIEESNPPITTEREAIAHAMHLGEIRPQLLEAERSVEHIRWRIHVKKSKTNWRVTMISQKRLLPFYSWTVSFDFEGNLLHEPICGYNK